MSIKFFTMLFFQKVTICFSYTKLTAFKSSSLFYFVLLLICFFLEEMQSLWHIRQFRIDLIFKGVHKHFGHPCIVCKLAETFSALSKASGGEIVSPTSLSIAIRKFSFNDNPFTEVCIVDVTCVLYFCVCNLC